jgi:hypothetical protein
MKPVTWIGIGATVAILALTGAASAQFSLTLTGPIQGNTVGPQSTSNPCVIAGTQCQQPATMGFNNYVQSGADPDYNAFSTTPTGTLADGVPGTPYTVGQLRTSGVQEIFQVAIDVNTAGGAGGGQENLSLFQVLIDADGGAVFNPTITYTFTGPALIGNVANNGNGFGDWTLGDISLVGLLNTATVLFHAVWVNSTDGAESFFIVPGPLAGAGLPGLLMACGGLLALARRRRQQLA